MRPDTVVDSILDSINEAVFIRDAGYNIIYVNGAMEKITGVKKKDAVGKKKCFQLFGFDQSCPDCFVDAMAAGQQYARQAKDVQAGGGKSVRMLVNASILGDAHNKKALVIMQDIARYLEIGSAYQRTIALLQEEIEKSRLMEESLRRSEEKYRATFEYTGTAMILIEENKIISAANRELERIIGYSREEVVGLRCWDEFVHPDDLEFMLTYHTERRKKVSNVPSRYEFRLIHKNGGIRDIMFTIGLIPHTTQSVGSLIDITEQKMLEKTLRESVERYNLLLQTIEDGFFEVDPEGNFLMVNDSLCKELGYTREELLGKNYSMIVDRENAKKVFTAFNDVYKSGRNNIGSSWEYTRKDGSKGMVEVSVSLLRDSDGNIRGFCGTTREITERVRMEEKLKFLSMHDSLTGLYNRAYFEEELIRVDNSRFLPLSIICFDLNGLKIVNDTMGHKAGDELLVAAARVIRKPFRSNDMVARVGGDEFVVVLPNTDEAAVQSVIRRIREAIDEHNSNNPKILISVAMGWATRHTNNVTLNEIYKQADASMYRDKLLSGKNTRSIAIKSLMNVMEKMDSPDQNSPDELRVFINSLGRRSDFL